MKSQIIIDAISAAENNTTAIKSALTPFLGQEGESCECRFGSIPTDKLEVQAHEGKIVRISYWSGLKWNARGGYGSPSVQVE